MGSSRHPVNPVRLSQLALSYGFAGLLVLGTIPCSRSTSMLLPTDILRSSMILLLGPAEHRESLQSTKTRTFSTSCSTESCAGFSHYLFLTRRSDL
jgi:hypothetical protein